jgi:glycolate oxidase iron-sulfur subunit
MNGVDLAKTCAIPGTPLAEASGGLDACVHCGFCLQACPTYLELEDENDSPRGRLVLMRAVVEGTLAVDDYDVRTHIDRCLGCRACETACPSGVPYGHLLEATRATLTAVQPNAPIARAILFMFARKPLMRLAMLGGQVARALRISKLLSRMPGRLGFAMAMLESTRASLRTREYTPVSDESRGKVAVLTGCVMEGLFAATNRATERTLSRNDYAIVPAPRQGCCGALHAHAGDAEAARTLARTNIVAFEESGAEFIAVNAAGCGAIMKEYGDLLARDDAWRDRAIAMSARVRDVSEPSRSRTTHPVTCCTRSAWYRRRSRCSPPFRSSRLFHLPGASTAAAVRASTTSSSRRRAIECWSQSCATSRTRARRMSRRAIPGA